MKMKKIKLFHNFINEKLGVLSGIEEMADVILKELSDKNYFKYKTRYLGKDITIHCFLKKSSDYYQELSGSFSIDDGQNFEFTIKIDELSKNTLIHELKHLDRAMRRGMKTDTYFYINHIGRYVAKEYGYLLKDKDKAKILIETFYYCNPDEFEAYYQDIYYEIKEMIEEDMSKKEKMEIIKENLENKDVFTFFKHFYENEFNLEDFFKSKEDCNLFLRDFFYRQELFFNLKDETISNLDKVKSWFKSTILNKFLKDRKLDVEVKFFNYYINKIVRNNYRKFYRLYALFT